MAGRCILNSDHEWRSFGIKQSAGWEHYMVHGNPQSDIERSRTSYLPQLIRYSDILLFRREKDYQAKYGNNPITSTNVGGLVG